MAANRVRELRTKLGLTQKELGKLAGVHNVTICQIETGVNQNPSHEVIEKLNKALGEDAFAGVTGVKSGRKPIPVPMNRMKVVRERLGLNQSDVAKKIGFTRAYVSQIEKHQLRGSDEARSRIVEALGEDPFAPPKPVQSNGSYAIIGGTKIPVASMEFMAEEPFKLPQQFTVTKTYNGFSLEGADMGLIRDFLNWMFPKDKP